MASWAYVASCAQVPPGFEEAVCSLAKLERAIVSCPADKAGSVGAAGCSGRSSLVPPPPEHADRVEFELHLLSMLQVLHSCCACSSCPALLAMLPTARSRGLCVACMTWYAGALFFSAWSEQESEGSCHDGRHGALRTRPLPHCGGLHATYNVPFLRVAEQVRDMTGRGEVTKRRVVEGVGEFPVDCPLEDCAVRVHFTARAVGAEQVSLSSPAPSPPMVSAEESTHQPVMCTRLGAPPCHAPKQSLGWCNTS